ncbi:MAG: YHYH protein [Bacteroidota bacterium]
MKTHVWGVVILLLCLSSCRPQKDQSAHVHAQEDGAPHPHQVAVNDYFGAYTLEDKTYGTRTEVKVKGDQRIMTTNSLPNHQTGNFPNQGNPNRISAQERTYTFPLKPVYTGKARWAREPGVALNGVKFEPQTAEVVVCESGEHFRMEAIQELVDLGLDVNHAHVQPTGAYHYHGTPTGVVQAFDQGEDLVHIGFAHDGFPIYYAKSGQYKPSYQLIDTTRHGTACTYSNPHTSRDVAIEGTKVDGSFGSDYEFIAGLGELDECNGIEVAGQYMYLVTDEFPYVGRCLMGEFKEQGRPGGPPHMGRDGRRPPPPGMGGHPPHPPRRNNQ